MIEGYKDQIRRARKRAAIGDARKGRVLASVGVTSSFVKSFKASASGCGRPVKLTLLGPLRI